MRKQIIVALAFLFTVFSFAQKKEFKAAEKAIKNKNYALAKDALGKIKPMLDGLDGNLKSKYNYLNAVALYADGKGGFGEVERSINALVTIKGQYAKDAKVFKLGMYQDFINNANKHYEAKRFTASSFNFERAYKLNKQDTTSLYYAAATAVNDKKYERALTLYEQLKKLGYTGIVKKYFAVSVQSNKKEPFPNQLLRDTAVRSKTHKNPTDEDTDSKKAEIVRNVALIHMEEGNSEKALQAFKDARAENPNDVNLIINEANLQYKAGNIEEFSTLLQKATKLQPNNAELQYNLGVISAESNRLDEAKKYYDRAIQIDPKYINAYINSAVLVLAKEKPLIEEMNSLGNSAADYKRYDVLKEQRQVVYQEAIPYLSKALEIDPNSESAASTLMNIYSALGETAKYKEMKARVEAMEAGN